MFLLPKKSILPPIKSRFFSGLFLFIFCSLIKTNTVLAEGTTGIKTPENTGLPNSTIKDILSFFLDEVITVFVVLAVIAFVITGIMYLLSFSGQYGMNENAKKYFGHSVIAVLIVGSAYIIITVINAILSANW